MPSKTTMTSVTELLISHFPVSIKKITGEYRGAADAFLQIIERDELISGTTVPAVSRSIYADDRFELDFQIDLSKAMIGISKTEAVFTTNDAATPGATFTVDYDKPVTSAEGTTVGDLAAATVVNQLEVLNVPGTVKEIYVINGNAAHRHVLVYNATGTVSNGAVGQTHDFYLPAGAGTGTLTASFGADGYYFSVGCIVAVSTTGGTPGTSTVLTLATAENWIKAIVA